MHIMVNNAYHYLAIHGTDAGRSLPRILKPECRPYSDDTLILETRPKTAFGSATVIDIMPLRGKVRGDSC
jgi:hypothetical protein